MRLALARIKRSAGDSGWRHLGDLRRGARGRTVQNIDMFDSLVDIVMADIDGDRYVAAGQYDDDGALE